MLKEPLLHFSVAGALLYLVVGWWNTDSNPNVISVNEDTLAEFYQYRTRSFSPDSKQSLDRLSENEMQLLIEQFITEEALYREALSLGLDAQDYVIRRRLVQKMEFLTEQTIDEPELEELKTYFEANQTDYTEPDRLTFTHVFISQDRYHEETAKQALDVLDQLQANQTPLHRATEYGDLFPYHTNYVERSEREIAAHFGAEFAQILFADQPTLNRWIGPLESAFGAHLVLIQSHQVGGPKNFSDVLPQVAITYQASRLASRRAAAVAQIVAKYEVDANPDLIARERADKE